MSLFRRECLHIGLESSGAAVIKLAGRHRPKVLADAQEHMALAPHAPSLAALAEHLATPAFKAKQVRVVLADTLVRYFIAERPQGVRSLAELRSLIAAHFEDQFGLSAQDWNIVSDLDSRVDRYLACAVPRPLVEAVRLLASSARLQLLALEPYALSEINRWRRHAPRGPAWFAATTPNAVTLGYWNKRGWQGMRCHAVTAGAEQSIGMLVERDSLIHGVAETAPIVCTGIVGQPVSITAAAGINPLGAMLWPGRSEAWSRGYRTALSGVWP